MATVIAGMTVSLDGFVTDAQGSAADLYPDLDALRDTAYMSSVIGSTGAVLMGRRTFEMGDPDSYVGDYEFQVPIFVLTHSPPATPPKQDERLTFTFVSGDVAAAVEQAKAAAGSKAVQVVGGATLVQALLRAGLVDELNLHVMPVLFGSGLRLLENVEPDGIRFETIGIESLGARTSLRFRVLRAA